MATDAHCTPIRWLFKYMIGRFEKTNDSFLDLCENLIAENKIKPGIQIDDTLNAHITPDGVIILGERLMCYLWCMCYFGLVSYEKAIAVYHENMNNGTNEDIDYEDVEIAEKYRRYAMSLKSGLVDWPDELPKPEEHDGNESINMTNQFFVCNEFYNVS